MPTIDDILAEQLEEALRDHRARRTWTDGFPYDNGWHNPAPPRGRPYDGAIINKDGELVIPNR